MNEMVLYRLMETGWHVKSPSRSCDMLSFLIGLRNCLEDFV
jgi:hypothetical protein